MIVVDVKSSRLEKKWNDLINYPFAFIFDSIWSLHFHHRGRGSRGHVGISRPFVRFSFSHCTGDNHYATETGTGSEKKKFFVDEEGEEERTRHRRWSLVEPRTSLFVAPSRTVRRLRLRTKRNEEKTTTTKNSCWLYESRVDRCFCFCARHRSTTKNEKKSCLLSFFSFRPSRFSSVFFSLSPLFSNINREKSTRENYYS